MGFDRLTIGITSRHCAGNDTVRQILERKLPATGIVTSDCIREEARKRGTELTRENLYKLGNEMREKEGGGVWARRAWEKARAEKEDKKYGVIGGIKSAAEVEELRNLGKGHFFLLAITAPLEMRHQRALARKREGEESLTLEHFKQQDERELQGGESHQNILAAIALADHTIENDGTLEELENKVDALLLSLRGKVQA